MKLRSIVRGGLVWLNALFLLSGVVRAGTNVVVWDTMTPGRTTVDLDARSRWKLVPSDLLALEKEPAKARSDPGYYGRNYQFSGDVVVENPKFIACFPADGEKISIFRKSGAFVMDIQPANSAKVRRFELVRNGADEVALDLSYTEDGSRDSVAGFSFGKNEIIGITAGRELRGLRVLAPVEYTVLPGFVGDDLIFGSAEEGGEKVLSLPAENMVLGLLKGEGEMLVITWPHGRQQMRFDRSSEKNRSLEIENDGQPVYVAALGAPGIWHREALTASFLEKDTAAGWKRPFSAKWQTQLTEGDTRATYPFRQSKGTVWRGVPGSYDYPVWFEGELAYFHLSKKVPPKGESIIYFLEGSDTPLELLTPADVLKATLGRAAAEPILDVSGRKLRTHHGASGSGVHRACTCGYTEAIQAVFEKGEEVDRKSFVDQSVSDMIYFVQRHLQRIDEYREFAKELTSFVQGRARQNPELKSYLEEIEQLAQQIPLEYENQKENMKSLAYAGELSKRTLALCGRKDAENLKAYMELLKAWRGMGGAQDYVVAQYHTLTRKLCQEAGYLAANDPKAIETAKEIRARCRQVLRNPDGYEIWPSY